MARAELWAETICNCAPLAVRAAKEVMLKTVDMTLEESLELERTKARQLSKTQDAQEGRKAFMEKRKPEFKGR
jgi:enoyl-CoA hydratase/carnithine racemase